DEQRLALARFDGDGTVDESFGDGGSILSIPVGVSAEVSPKPALALTATGDILVGTSADTRRGGWLIAKLHPDGSLDTSFGSEGIYRQGFRFAGDGVVGLATQRSGKILVLGSVGKEGH